MRPHGLSGYIQAVRRGFVSAFVPSLLPATCAGCGVVGEWFCSSCREAIREDYPAGCQRCGRRGSRKAGCWRCTQLFPKSLKRVRAGYLFDGPVRRAVHLFKYSGEHERGRELGVRLAARFDDLFPDAGIDAIVPVPLHPRRYRQRGFNQSLILAEELEKALDIPVVEVVARTRNTTPQVGLSADRRLANLKDAFAPVDVSPSPVSGRRILIVDDVTTTGATVAAVAESLQRMGAREISAFALAREQ